jgi:methyl-accepting chemotaxis protein
MAKKSLRKRLMFSYVIISLLLFIVGGVSFFYQKKILKNYGQIVTVNLPNAVLLGDMNLEISKMSLGIIELSLGQSNSDEAQALKEKINLGIVEFEKFKVQYEANKISAEGESEVYAAIKDNWPKFKNLILNNIEVAASTDIEKRKSFFKVYKEELGPMVHDFSENLNFVLDFQKAASSENIENAEIAATQSQITLSITVIAGVLFAITFGLYFSNNLTKEILQIAEVLRNIAQKISNESSEMSHSSSNLLGSVEAQADALQKTSSSTEELSAMVKRNEESAENSKLLSSKSTESSLRGRNAVTNMQTAIHEIDDSNKDILSSVQKSNSNITEISNSIRQIGEKTQIINEIVFQTKLLSFNASVEAARAGEQGKGFAVVAEEVGNLAQMSGNAAKEISELLESSIAKVEDIISESKKEVQHLMEQSNKKISQGKEASDNCQIVLDEVVGNVTLVNDLLSEISQASKEQTLGISEISKAISQLDHNTHENTKTAKRSEASSNDLASEATRLENIVNDLTITVKGS